MEHESQRQRVEREIEIDLKKSIKHLLADVHDESVNALREHAPTTRTMARFASLLSILALRAEDNSKVLERYTVMLVRLTWAFALLAGATFIAVGVQIFLMFYPPK